MNQAANSTLIRNKLRDFQVATYRENVLTGFQQVEDNLAAVRILDNEAKVQNDAVVSAAFARPFRHALQGRSDKLSRGDHRTKCRPRG